jgi:hypothetical protein
MACEFLTPSDSFSAEALVLQACELCQLGAPKLRGNGIFTDGDGDTGLTQDVQSWSSDEPGAEHENFAAKLTVSSARQDQWAVLVMLTVGKP